MSTDNKNNADSAGKEPDVKPVNPIPGCIVKCNLGVVPDVKPVDQPLEVKSAESGVAPDVKTVNQPLDDEKHAYESRVVWDVISVDQLLRGVEFLDPENRVTQLLGVGVVGHLFVHQVKADPNPVLLFSDRDNDVTQLFSERVAGHQSIIQVEVDDNSGET